MKSPKTLSIFRVAELIMYAFRFAGFALLTHHFTCKPILRRDLLLPPAPGFHIKQFKKAFQKIMSTLPILPGFFFFAPSEQKFVVIC